MDRAYVERFDIASGDGRRGAADTDNNGAATVQGERREPFSFSLPMEGKRKPDHAGTEGKEKKETAGKNKGETGVSFDLVQWAFQQPIKPGGAKWVLVAMAHKANPEFFAAMETLATVTGLDVKTCRKHVHSLINQGFIQATGSRKGTSKQIVEYRFMCREYELFTRDSQKREATKSGRLPDFPGETPKNGRPETPKNGRHILEVDKETILPAPAHTFMGTTKAILGKRH